MSWTSTGSRAPSRSLTIAATCVRSIRSRACADTASATSGWSSSHCSNSARRMTCTSAGPDAVSVAVRRPPAITVTSPTTCPSPILPTITSPYALCVVATSSPDEMTYTSSASSPSRTSTSPSSETDAAQGYVEVPHLWRPEFHPVHPPSSTRRGADGESSPWGPNDPPRGTSMPSEHGGTNMVEP